MGLEPKQGLFGVALTVPAVTWAIGVDGAASFQIVAGEELGIGARTLGIGLGLGVLSVPLQLWAAQLPLWQARRNLQLFLVVTGVLAWALAGLVVFAPPGSPWATSALAIAVTAEIVLSVFYATSWQPLQSYVLTSRQRQRISSWGRAASWTLLAASLVLFGWAGTPGRVLILLALGVLPMGLAVLVRRVPAPPRPTTAGEGKVDSESEGAAGDRPAGPGPRPRLPREFVALCVTAGITTFTGWPLFVTYAGDVLWPSVNLGVLAAIQLGGGIVAGLTWRATVTGLVGRARIGAAGLVLATGVLALVPAPVTGGVAGAVTLAAAVTWSLAYWTLLTAMMEVAHQVLDHDVTVRAFTIYDVVVSTAMQVGLLVSGFLVAASAGSGWPVDPYRAFLLVGATAVLLTTCRRNWPGPRWAARADEEGDREPAGAAAAATGS